MSEWLRPPYVAEGEKVLLRPMEEQDAGMVARWRSSERIASRYIYRIPISEAEEITYFHKVVETGRNIHLMICEKESGIAVGCVVFNNPEPEHNEMESGLFIGEESALGKGYGPDALRTGCKYVFANWKIGDPESASLVSRIYTDNEASKATHRKAGYREAGILKDVESTDGSVADMLQMKIESRDFR